MTQNKNLQALSAAFDAFNRNDLAAASGFLAEDIVYTIRGRATVSGTYRGRQAVAEALGRIKQLTSGSMTAKPEAVLADGENIMMYMHVTGVRPDGRRYDNHQAYFYRFRDGRLAEGQTIPVDQHAFEAFFAD